MTAELAAPSFRFRVTQHLPGLRARGLAPEILPLPSSPWARWRAVRSLPPASIVLVHRTLLNSFELARLRRNGTRLLYDFDDAWTVPDPRRPGLAAVERRRRFARMIARADTVLVGQESLAALARTWARSPVHVVPTTVDPRPYDRAPRHADAPADATVASGHAATSSSDGSGRTPIRPI